MDSAERRDANSQPRSSPESVSSATMMQLFRQDRDSPDPAGMFADGGAATPDMTTLMFAESGSSLSNTRSESVHDQELMGYTCEADSALSNSATRGAETTSRQPPPPVRLTHSQSRSHSISRSESPLRTSVQFSGQQHIGGQSPANSSGSSSGANHNAIGMNLCVKPLASPSAIQILRQDAQSFATDSPSLARGDLMSLVSGKQPRKSSLNNSSSGSSNQVDSTRSTPGSSSPPPRVSPSPPETSRHDSKSSLGSFGDAENPLQFDDLTMPSEMFPTDGFDLTPSGSCDPLRAETNERAGNEPSVGHGMSHAQRSPMLHAHVALQINTGSMNTATDGTRSMNP